MAVWIVVGFVVIALLLSAAAVMLLRRSRENARARALLAALYNPEYRRQRAAGRSEGEPEV